MGSRIGMYCLAIAIPVASVLALASVGSRVTPLMCVLAAAAGVVAVALIDVGLNGRYFLANRAEAKRLRRAEVDQKFATDPPPDLPL
jgi:hypothetical protein